MANKQFPIIADDEAMLVEMPHMNLYDESDFISNIVGDYVDRNYLEWQPISNQSSLSPNQRVDSNQSLGQVQSKAEKSYAEQAREEARADLKKKRSASYLTVDIPHKKRKNKGGLYSSQPHLVKQDKKLEHPGELAKFGSRLYQASYILVDLEQGQDKVESKSGKNRYDFLKTSQVYNKDELQKKKEHKISQELQLNNIGDHKE